MCCAVWVGAIAGLATAIAIGAVIVALFYVAQTQLFVGIAREVFTGFMFLIASYLITVLAFAMLRFKGYEQKWEEKLTSAAVNLPALSYGYNRSPMSLALWRPNCMGNGMPCQSKLVPCQFVAACNIWYLCRGRDRPETVPF